MDLLIIEEAKYFTFNAILILSFLYSKRKIVTESPKKIFRFIHRLSPESASKPGKPVSLVSQ